MLSSLLVLLDDTMDHPSVSHLQIDWSTFTREDPGIILVLAIDSFVSFCTDAGVVVDAVLACTAI
jgi:hypothetical protein